jgi:hypothetical protein
MGDEYRCNWLLKVVESGFVSIMAVHGTEYEMTRYVASEIGHALSYSAMSDDQFEAYKSLGGKCYLAPEA